jgi:hypothetical protein
MSMCPNGHRSTSSDWCDVCGLRIQEGAAAPPPPPPPPSYGGSYPGAPDPFGERQPSPEQPGRPGQPGRPEAPGGSPDQGGYGYPGQQPDPLHKPSPPAAPGPYGAPAAPGQPYGRPQQPGQHAQPPHLGQPGPGQHGQPQPEGQHGRHDRHDPFGQPGQPGRQPGGSGLFGQAPHAQQQHAPQPQVPQPGRPDPLEKRPGAGSPFGAAPGQAPAAPGQGGYGYPGPGAQGRPGEAPGQGAGSFGGYVSQPTAAIEMCPRCGTPREGSAQFCEECRHDFLAFSGGRPPQQPGGPYGQGGPGQGPGAAQAAAAPGGFAPPYTRYDSERSRPSQINRPAEPIAPEQITSGSGDFLLSPPGGGQGHGQPGQAQGQGGPGHQAPGTSTGPWTAVVAADREYFTAMMARSGPDAQRLFFPQYSPELRVALTGSQLSIGRRRHSTGEAPDIDLGRAPEDPGVSHQHAVLVHQPDGGWAVMDQNSTNGTTLNLAEDPIAPFVPVALREGDRVHVGAWTTITIVRG